MSSSSTGSFRVGSGAVDCSCSGTDDGQIHPIHPDEVDGRCGEVGRRGGCCSPSTCAVPPSAISGLGSSPLPSVSCMFACVPSGCSSPPPSVFGSFSAILRNDFKDRFVLLMLAESLDFLVSKRLKSAVDMGCNVPPCIVSRATCVEAVDFGLGARGQDPYQLGVL